MGIKNLNKVLCCIKSRYKTPDNFETLIIDGSNFIYVYIDYYINSLDKNNSVSGWDGYNIDILTQLKYISLMAYKRMLLHINKVIKQYNIKDVIIVFDGKNTHQTTINLETFNILDKEYIKQTHEIKENGDIILDNKTEEICKRSKERHISKDNKELISKALDNGFCEIMAEITKKDQKTINAIYKQSFGFKDNTLKWIVHKCIKYALYNKEDIENNNLKKEDYDPFNLMTDTKINASFKIIRSAHEADPYIKFLCENIIKDKEQDILFLSNDTDFKILFCNNEHIYLSNIFSNYKINVIHPFTIWTSIYYMIPINELYEYLIRLSALLGNDQTKNIKCLLNINDNMNEFIIWLYSIFNICPPPYEPENETFKFILSYPQKTGNILKVEELDNIIKQYDQAFYNRYIESVIILSNYNKNTDILPKHVDNSYDLLWNNIYPYLNQEFKNDNFYKFNNKKYINELIESSEIIEDPKEYFKNINIYEIIGNDNKQETL